MTYCFYKSFIDYYRNVGLITLRIFGLGVEDFDEEFVVDCFSKNIPPQQCAEILGEMHNLTNLEY